MEAIGIYGYGKKKGFELCGISHKFDEKQSGLKTKKYLDNKLNGGVCLATEETGVRLLYDRVFIKIRG